MGNALDMSKNARDYLILPDGNAAKKYEGQMSSQELRLLHLIRMARMGTIQMDDLTRQFLLKKQTLGLLSGTNGCDIPSPKEQLGLGMAKAAKLMTEISSTSSKVTKPEPLSDREILQHLDNMIGHVPLKTKEPPKSKEKEPFPMRALTQKGQAPKIFQDEAL